MSEGLIEAQAGLDDAKRQRREAVSLVEALEERVREGNEEVAALELGQQHGLLRLASLQQERAEKQLRAAEAQALEDERRRALDAARADLAAGSVAVIAQKYGAALVALDDLAAVCDAREAAIVRHREVFERLGMKGNVLAGPPQVVVQVDGERFVAGDCQAESMVTRVVGRLSRVRAFRQLSRLSSNFMGYHEVELVLTGLPRAEARSVEETTGLAQPLVVAARAAVESGEAA
ncbi:hypothetical protein [Streptomyces incanus]|uniref:Uncharacterized protein n=1 Tax=Streptomyces incanus TaxID=887453 RepID=A0ABW0XRH0_9ACTN